jgi:hypothetical protein
MCVATYLSCIILVICVKLHYAYLYLNKLPFVVT